MSYSWICTILINKKAGWAAFRSKFSDSNIIREMRSKGLFITLRSNVNVVSISSSYMSYRTAVPYLEVLSSCWLSPWPYTKHCSLFLHQSQSYHNIHTLSKTHCKYVHSTSHTVQKYIRGKRHEISFSFRARVPLHASDSDREGIFI